MTDFCPRCGGPIDEDGMCNYCAYCISASTDKDMNTTAFGIGLAGVLVAFGAVYIKSYYLIKPYIISLAGDRAEIAEMILDASIFAEIGLFFILVFSMKYGK